MKAINAQGLEKRYHTRVKAEGLKASFQGLFKPEYRDVCAVQDVSFTVEPGEILAFIGPNGAGKSTTIKMMTGILSPSGGQVRVLGMDPMRERQKLSYQIGSVFGQKSQLSFHLPPMDSFALLGAIYDIDRQTLHERVAELTERFELGDLLKVPVRKLSLGQRIRCEIAASLLHQPQILFLDEPTIGLDVIVKQSIREWILQLNREHGTTIFLTSHDAGDVEQVCKRAIVIDRGRLVMDESVKRLRHDYLNRKVIEVRFSQQAALPALEGVVVEKQSAYAARLAVDTRLRPVGEVLSLITQTGSVADITVSDPPMEQIIAAIFQQKGQLAQGGVEGA